MKKLILDVACGSRMFWFDKQNPNVLFVDIRKEEHTLCDGRSLIVKPDVVADFMNLGLKSNYFKMVVFDPPHLKHLGQNSWMCKKYGVLSKDWEEDLRKGFNECWRVLEENGTLIFKWSERDVKVSHVLGLFNKKPLFGHTTRKHHGTMWVCFAKTSDTTHIH